MHQVCLLVYLACSTGRKWGREILKGPIGLYQCSKHLVNRYQTPSGCEVSSCYLDYLKYRVSLLKSCSVSCKAEFKIVQSTSGLVWELGAVSALLKPASPPLQFVYCQVCCEPFHKFCLEESERPQEDQLENWCCRRCKFCHVCGRQHQATKVPQNHWETQQHPHCSQGSSGSRGWPASMCQEQGLCALGRRPLELLHCSFLLMTWIGDPAKNLKVQNLHPFAGCLYQWFFSLIPVAVAGV